MKWLSHKLGYKIVMIKVGGEIPQTSIEGDIDLLKYVDSVGYVFNKEPIKRDCSKFGESENIKVLMTEQLNEKVIDGKKVSPILSDKVKNYLIDIDGTVCEDIPNEEPWRMVDAEIYPGALGILNKWYDEGNIITFFTSRTESHREVTTKWLDRHGFKYHGILMGKPRGGNYHWIDNHIVKATRYVDKWADLIKRTKTIEVFPE